MPGEVRGDRGLKKGRERKEKKAAVTQIQMQHAEKVEENAQVGEDLRGREEIVMPWNRVQSEGLREEDGDVSFQFINQITGWICTTNSTQLEVVSLAELLSSVSDSLKRQCTFLFLYGG